MPVVTNNDSTPRDLGLLRWWAGCQVSLEITDLSEVLEVARTHCRMRPERFADLHQNYPAQWSYAMTLIERNRAKRRAGINLKRRRRRNPERAANVRANIVNQQLLAERFRARA